MVQPPYEPYYLHQNHRQQPPEYFYPHNITDTINPNFNNSRDFISNSSNNPSISSTPIIPIHIPKSQRHINTLFVSGLPDDVMPREIHNLFRRRPGFDSCQLKFTGRGNQVVAFVTFYNHQSAVLALQALDGVKFDPQAGSVLHIELARSNSRRKHKPGSGPYVVIDKRKQSAYDEDTSSDDGDESDQNEGPDSSNNNMQSTVKSEENVKVGGTVAAATERMEKVSQGDLKPCSTLFIANLGPNCTEDELRQALSQYPGFNGLKLRARGGMPVAFADYELPLLDLEKMSYKPYDISNCMASSIKNVRQQADLLLKFGNEPIVQHKHGEIDLFYYTWQEVEQATQAMQALQDSTLPSSDRGGMHIEYARSKMRKP